MLLYAHVLFCHMCNQTSTKLLTMYFLWSQCYVFFRFFSQTDKLLWIFKVLIAAIKPKHNSRLLNYTHGCHLWDVTDREGRHRRVAGPRSQCLSKMWIAIQSKIQCKSHQHFVCCDHFQWKQTNRHLSFMGQREGQLSKSMVIAGSSPSVCSLLFLTLWKILLWVCIQILLKVILSQRLPILLNVAKITSVFYSLSFKAALKHLIYPLLVMTSHLCCLEQFFSYLTLLLCCWI